jgi:7-cyano-7-deazaguanine synthase in queuosine biosynthesis
MPAFTLRLNAPAVISAEEAKTSFYWLADGSSSFTTGLGPNLGILGPVPDLSVDLVRVAVAVYAADRSTYRATADSNWTQRNIRLEIPVSDAARWQAVAVDLASVVGFLTGDSWTLQFNEEPAPVETVGEKPETSSKRVVLLSGGADSAVGALLSRSQLAPDERHILLSHFSASFFAPIQRAIAEAAEQLLPGLTQQHIQIHLSRKRKRMDGTDFPTEQSSRSRSLLFLALGLAVASVDAVPLWIPENGFAALNPPLGPERRGSLSTRTTHPTFLTGLADVLSNVGAHGLIENPFASITKGKMFKSAADLVGGDKASSFLSATNSCAHTGQRSFGISPTQGCGVCFGCVIRRASFTASGVHDATAYIVPGTNSKLQAWLGDKSVEPAVRNFVTRGVRQRDLMAMSLPNSYPLSDALDLCQRGINELAGLQL